MYQAQTAHSTDKALRVLIIEDNTGDTRPIREMLDKGSFDALELTSVDRVSAGLTHLSDYEADVILLDLTLPDSQGIETFISIHAHAPHVPTIVLSLTGMANRTLFLDRLTQALALAKRNNWMVALMFLDLDRFKVINDTLGHAGW